MGGYVTLAPSIGRDGPNAPSIPADEEEKVGRVNPGHFCTPGFSSRGEKVGRVNPGNFCTPGFSSRGEKVGRVNPGNFCTPAFSSRGDSLRTEAARVRPLRTEEEAPMRPLRAVTVLRVRPLRMEEASRVHPLRTEEEACDLAPPLRPLQVPLVVVGLRVGGVLTPQ